MKSQKTQEFSYSRPQTCLQIQDAWEVLSNPPSTKSADDDQEEIKCLRVLTWLKQQGIKEAYPESILESKEDKHKRQIVKTQHSKVQRPSLRRGIKDFSCLRIDINFQQLK